MACQFYHVIHHNFHLSKTFKLLVASIKTILGLQKITVKSAHNYLFYYGKLSPGRSFINSLMCE